NLKFDLEMLVSAGMPWPQGLMWDTMLLPMLLEASAAVRPNYGLGDVVQRFLGSVLDKSLQTSDWSGSLSHEQLQYAARDVAVLWPLIETFDIQLFETDLMEVAELEAACLPALVWLELAGAPFDYVRWEELAILQAARLQQCEETLHKVADIN